VTRFEIRTASGSAVREDAPDEATALGQALERGELEDGADGSIELADELPVGYYGEDPEAPAVEYGDHV
jgi:hypothetical protein